MDVYSWEVDDLGEIGAPPILNTTEEKVRYFFAPLLRPLQKHTDAQWAHLLVALLTGWYGYKLVYGLYALTFAIYNTTSAIVNMPLVLTSLVSYGFIVLIIVLLIKGKKWGWLLAAFEEQLIISTCTIFVYSYFSGSLPESYSLLRTVSVCFMPLVLIFLLWARPITRYFNISRKNKLALLAIIGVTIVIRIVSYYIFLSNVRVKY